MDNPFCPGCINTHCCLTCNNYGGLISFIPTQTYISCNAPERKYDKVTLHIGSWPKINGKLTKKCKYWKKRKQIK